MDWLLLVILGLGQTAEQEAQSVDTSDWACEQCPYETYFGFFDLGIGWVSDEAGEEGFLFRNYTGLDDGLFPVVGGDFTYSGERQFWRADLDNLGFEARRATIDGNIDGTYNFFAEYQEIPRYINGTGVTPFLGVGSDTLTLPDGWVVAPRTDELPLLDESLRPVALQNDRDIIRLGFAFTPPGRFEYDVAYERQMREGVNPLAGAFLFTGAILPAPVDYVTDTVDASVSYYRDNWQAQVGYTGSFFDNRNRGLFWENPLSPLVPGADQGQLALLPDNQSHQISLSGNYIFGQRAVVSAAVSAGRLNQDEEFLPYTINPNLNPGSLPRNDLDGRVDLFDVSLRADTEITDRFGINASYAYHERDNDTPVDEFTPVTMDLFVNPAIRNRPFSYDRHRFLVEGDYRLMRFSRLEAGVEYDTIDRQFGDDIEIGADEITGYGRFRVRPVNVIDAIFEISVADRDGEPLVPRLDNPIINPFLRNFYLVDRERRRGEFAVTLSPNTWLQLTASGAATRDEYEDSLIGLTEADFRELTFDASVTPVSFLTLNGFVSYERIDSRVNGSEAISTPDWFGNVEDEIRTAGAGIAFTGLTSKNVDLSFDYVFSDSKGSYNIDDGSGAPPFPDLNTTLHGLRFRATYPLQENSSVLLDVYHESFDSDDWQLDGVAPDTIFNLLTLGEFAHNYDITTVSLWYRRFF